MNMRKQYDPPAEIAHDWRKVFQWHKWQHAARRKAQRRKVK
jgi:hypothetical protein